MTHVAVADPEFHLGEIRPLKVGAPNYCLAIFSRKLHENEKQLDQGARTPLDRQLFSFTMIS